MPPSKPINRYTVTLYHEDSHERLNVGVSYADALGGYTQCVIDRGDTVGLGVR